MVLVAKNEISLKEILKHLQRNCDEHRIKLNVMKTNGMVIVINKIIANVKIGINKVEQVA